MFDCTGGSNIFGGAAAGVVRTSTGGSPSSPSPIFKRERGFFFSWQEPRRSRSILVNMLRLLPLLYNIVQCVRAWFSKENRLWLGRGLRWGFLIWLAAQQVLYGGAWNYFSYVLASCAYQIRNLKMGVCLKVGILLINLFVKNNGYQYWLLLRTAQAHF